MFPKWGRPVGGERVIVFFSGELPSQMSPARAFMGFVSFLQAPVSHGAIASNINTESA